MFVFVLILHVTDEKQSDNEMYFLNITSRVKSWNFGHQVNSGTHLQTVKNPDETAPYEPSHLDFHCLLS